MVSHTVYYSQVNLTQTYRSITMWTTILILFLVSLWYKAGQALTMHACTKARNLSRVSSFSSSVHRHSISANKAIHHFLRKFPFSVGKSANWTMFVCKAYLKQENCTVCMYGPKSIYGSLDDFFCYNKTKFIQIKVSFFFIQLHKQNVQYRIQNNIKYRN